MDLNADLGEGFGHWSLGDDDALLDVVTSANVACGFHAGDASIMRRTCEAAHARGVRIGAHVGYRDLAGFGRRALAVDAATLRDETTYQLGALAACAGRAGARVAYAKPHGALYHRCATDAQAARAVAEAALAFDPALHVMGPPGSQLLRVAQELGLATAAEGFADRAYRADGTLVDRGEPGAVLDADDALAQARAIAAGEPIGTAGGGEPVTLDVRTICVHGDTPDAVALARAVRDALERAGADVRSFA